MGSRAGAPSPGLHPISAAHSSGSLPPRPAGPSTCAHESLPTSCPSHSHLLPRSPNQALPGPAPSTGEGFLRKGSQQAANTACLLLGCPPPCPEPLCRSSMAHDSLRNPLSVRGHRSSTLCPERLFVLGLRDTVLPGILPLLPCAAPPTHTPRRCKHGPGQRGFLFFTVFPGELFPP